MEVNREEDQNNHKVINHNRAITHNTVGYSCNRVVVDLLDCDTPLALAARSGSIEMVRYLIECGVTLRDYDRITFLCGPFGASGETTYVASFYGNMKVLPANAGSMHGRRCSWRTAAIGTLIVLSLLIPMETT